MLRNPKNNMGFRSRQEITTGAKSVTMFLPLNAVLGSHRNIDTVMLGVKHTYIIERSLPINYIHRAAAAAAGKFNIDICLCGCPRFDHRSLCRRNWRLCWWQDTQRSLCFEQVRVYRNQFGATKLSPTWRVTSVASEQLPRHVFVVFVSVKRNGSRDGSQDQNNHVFDNAKLTRLSVCVNSTQYLDREIETNFAEACRNYLRPYMLFQEAVKKYLDTDLGSLVSVEDFVSLYPIMHIDVSKHRERLEMGMADLEIR